MKAIIRCSVCDAVIGEIDKPEITDEDVALYRQMVTCENGHVEAADLTEQPQ